MKKLIVLLLSSIFLMVTALSIEVQAGDVDKSNIDYVLSVDEDMVDIFDLSFENFMIDTSVIFCVEKHDIYTIINQEPKDIESGKRIVSNDSLRYIYNLDYGELENYITFKGYSFGDINELRVSDIMEYTITT